MPGLEAVFDRCQLASSELTVVALETNLRRLRNGSGGLPRRDHDDTCWRRGRVASGPVIQLCWIVDDIPTAVQRWVQAVGAGPFHLAAHIQFDELTYRGGPATLDQSSALGQWGAGQVELLQ